MTLIALKKELEKSISNTESSIIELKSQQKILSDNADKLKTSIKESTDSLSNDLKRKEKQLLRQVEFVTAHQKSLIDAQLTNIWLTKGSLIGTQEILNKCTEEDIETLKKIEQKLPISLKPIAPIKMITVNLQPDYVSRAIDKLGEAHLPATIMHYDSPVVPAKVEDYGDSQQDVLHKSLERSDEFSSIQVTFPKLPPTSWLASSNKASDTSSYVTMDKDYSFWLNKSSLSQPVSRNAKECCSSSTLSSIDDESENNFHIFDMPPSKYNSPVRGKRDSSIRTSVSSSIEVIPSLDYQKDYYCSLYGEKADPNIRSLKALHSKPLSCQANERCSSYSECVCDGYCEGLAKEKVAQTNKWLEKSLLITPEEKKVQSNNVWLSDLTSRQSGQKRKLCSSIPERVVPVLTHMNAILNSDHSGWLACSSVAKIDYLPKLNKTWISKSDVSYPVSPSKVDVSQLSDKILYTPSTTTSWIFTDENCCKKPKYSEDEKKKEIKDNKNSSEQQKGFVMSVEELKEAIEEVYETTVSHGGLFKRKENKEFWLSADESKIENKLKHLSMTQQIDETNSLFPKKLLNGNDLNKWLVPKC